MGSLTETGAHRLARLAAQSIHLVLSPLFSGYRKTPPSMDIYMNVPESNPGLQAWVAGILSTNPSTWILQVKKKKTKKTYDNDIPTSSNHMKS